MTTSELILSVRQPWAWLLIRPDIVGAEARALASLARLIKDIENRDWSTRVRGRVLVHASKGMTGYEYDDCCNFVYHEFGHEIVLPQFEDLPRGGIVGAVNITDCVTSSPSPWFVGRFGFACRDAEPLPFMPCRGQLGFFRI